MPSLFQRLGPLIPLFLGSFSFVPLVVPADEPTPLRFEFQAAAQAGRPGIADAWKTPALLTSQRALYPLTSLSTARASDPLPFLSAAEAWTSGGGAIDPDHGELKLHPNDPPGWPNEPCVLWKVGETTSGRHLFHSTWVNLWTKAQLTAAGTPRLRLGTSSHLAVTYTAWVPEFREGALPAQIRFVVRNAGTTYVSEFAWGDLIDQPRRIVLNNPTSTRWAPVVWSGDSFRLPDTLEYQTVVFDDVEAVGWVQQNSGAHLRVYRWNRFECNAESHTGPTSYASRSSRPPHVRNAGMAWVMRAAGHVPSSVAGRPASLSLD